MAGVGAVSNSGEQGSSELAMDRISSLPLDILNIILGKMSIVDAIKMSVLSKYWRYKWYSLSSFDLDCVSITSEPNVRNLRYDTVAFIVNEFLLHHTDNIITFSLKTCFRSYYPDLYQWMHHLSQQSVEALSLEEIGRRLIQMPSYLFLFERLQYLFLKNCTLQIPPTFGGYKSLRELSFDNVGISQDDFDLLILACPLVENLTLLYIRVLSHLRIKAPRLARLVVDTHFKDFVIRDTPFLIEVCIYECVGEAIDLDWRNVIHCLSGIVSLRTLALPGNFIKLLANDIAFEDSPLRNRDLTSIFLRRLRFEKFEVFRVCLFLLSSCPIKEFGFTVESAKGPQLIAQFVKTNRGQFFFPELKSLTFGSPHRIGLGATVNFVEFVCAHSPKLEFLTIRKTNDSEINPTRTSQMLARFRRRCPQALVRFMLDDRYIDL